MICSICKKPMICKNSRQFGAFRWRNYVCKNHGAQRSVEFVVANDVKRCDAFERVHRFFEVFL
jgi:hypothetical protein